MTEHRQPPVEHRFKPGQSGNPNGRPKGAKDWRTIFNERLDMIENSREKIADVVITKALEGDLASFDRLADRTDGKAPQSIINQYQDAEGNSVNVNVTIGGTSE